MQHEQHNHLKRHMTTHKKAHIYELYGHTRRGRSRAQHVRDREADIEGAKNWRLVHLRSFKGESPHLGCVFMQRARRGKWRGPKGRADSLAIAVLWRK